jgi:hypothetical protein
LFIDLWWQHIFWWFNRQKRHSKTFHLTLGSKSSLKQVCYVCGRLLTTKQRRNIKALQLWLYQVSGILDFIVGRV